MAASHVPKFGNWDGDNVPYTAYFDNARKGKAAGGGGGGGKMINPNDPEENPDAFALMSPEKQPHNNYHRNTKKSMSSPSEENLTDNKSSSSNSGKRHQRKRSELKKNKNESSSNSFIPAASPNTPRNGRSNPYDDLSYRSASVPKFGAWDEMDPKSGEGYTVIFNKVKEEKQIAASKLPNVNQQPTYYSTYTHKPSKSKMCCCLF